MQFSENTVRKRDNSVQKGVTNHAFRFRLVNDQRNSQIANQMPATDGANLNT